MDSMAGLAVDLGYFDQSHFIKEFKRFQGFTPAEFIRRIKAW
jgi:AraC-like DNA-binding protein